MTRNHLRHIIFALLTLVFSHATSAHILDALPEESQVLNGYQYDSVVTRLDQSPLHDIEGVWQFIDNGATIVIERFDPDVVAGYQANIYRIIIIKSPMLSIENGTLMGYISNTAKRNCYEGKLYTKGSLDGILSKPQTFTLNLTDDYLLSFHEYKTEVKIDLWRWIPYMYRVGFSIKNTRPKGLDGCVRIYPQSTTHPPLNPRYL